MIVDQVAEQLDWDLVLPPFTFPHADEKPRPWSELLDSAALKAFTRGEVRELWEENQPIKVDLVVHVEKVRQGNTMVREVQCPVAKWNTIAASWVKARTS